MRVKLTALILTGTSVRMWLHSYGSGIKIIGHNIYSLVPTKFRRGRVRTNIRTARKSNRARNLPRGSLNVTPIENKII